MFINAVIQCSTLQYSYIQFSVHNDKVQILAKSITNANAKFIGCFLRSVRLTMCRYQPATLHSVASHQNIMDFCLCFSTSYVKATYCCILQELVPVQGSEDGGSRLLLVICCCDSYFTCSQVGENTRRVAFCTAEDMCRASRKVSCICVEWDLQISQQHRM
jgi:hypothetical protein